MNDEDISLRRLIFMNLLGVGLWNSRKQIAHERKLVCSFGSGNLLKLRIFSIQDFKQK